MADAMAFLASLASNRAWSQTRVNASSAIIATAMGQRRLGIPRMSATAESYHAGSAPRGFESAGCTAAGRFGEQRVQRCAIRRMQRLLRRLRNDPFAARPVAAGLGLRARR